MVLNYTIPPVEGAPVGNYAPPTGKVIFTIFAGRKRYLECLSQFLDKLIAKGLITEVHLWDYVRDPPDREYILELAKKTGYVYMKPTKGMKHWDEYYNYYINSDFAPEDILIKCDDDVIYIDDEQFAAYLNEVRDNGLYYPNIVNNDVCAYIQMKYGVHNLISDRNVIHNYGEVSDPLGGWRTGWYAKYECASAIHTAFLEDPTRFKVNARVVSWKGRISINMFAGKFSTIKSYFSLYLTHGDSEDEAFFSFNVYKYVSGSNYIVPFFNVVHFSFASQNSLRLDSEYLGQYKQLISSKRNIPYYKHLDDLSNKDCTPKKHFEYLLQLKTSGFEPKVIYDIGSCVLHWTKKAKLLWPNATYILFDGFREAEFLYDGYQYHIGVLCNSDNKELNFYKNVDLPGGNSYYREVGCENGKYFPESSACKEIGMTLDTIVRQKGFPAPDLIKIDVQGAEKDIIIGGINTIKHAKHLIVEMQHTNYNDGAPKVDETLPYIESLGWKCVAPLFCNNGPDGDYGFVKLS